MAAVDDIYNEITRNSRTRKGRSFFPAANAINSTPQGQTLGVGDSRYGFRALPPDQNPAYQAALSRSRVNRNDMTTVYTPSGGTIQVPNRSLGGALAAVKGSTVQPKTAYASDYAKGYGAPTPYIANIGAPNQNYQVAGGVANPIENLTPQARVAGGVGGTLDYFKTNPSLNVAVNALRGFGSNIASWFGGGNLPSVPATANAAQPSPTPFQTPFPNPTPTPTPPRRYSDFGYY